MLLKMSI
jgi:hypothetical protein